MGDFLSETGNFNNLAALLISCQGVCVIKISKELLVIFINAHVQK